MEQREASDMILDQFRLDGRVALVTGGSRGLGRAIAVGLAEAGCDVAVVSRNLSNCRAVASEIEDRTGRRSTPVSWHVGRWDQLDGLVQTVIGELGRLDILINNAGVSPIYDRVVDVTENLFDSVLNLNLKGPFRLSALAAEQMALNNGGSIVNISSVASVRPYPRVVPYAAAKAGLNAMTLALAHAFAPTVRVNCLLAGPFETDVARSWPAEMRERRTQALAAGRIGEPEEIVGAVLYLVSPAASFTTGAVLAVDGGVPVP